MHRCNSDVEIGSKLQAACILGASAVNLESGKGRQYETGARRINHFNRGQPRGSLECGSQDIRMHGLLILPLHGMGTLMLLGTGLGIDSYRQRSAIPSQSPIGDQRRKGGARAYSTAKTSPATTPNSALHTSCVCRRVTNISTRFSASMVCPMPKTARSHQCRNARHSRRHHPTKS